MIDEIQKALKIFCFILVIIGIAGFFILNHIKQKHIEEFSSPNTVSNGSTFGPGNQNQSKMKFVEAFSNPIIAENGMTFGPGNQFTFSLDQNGTFIIDGKSGVAWERSDSYRDSAFIRSTNPLPKTYKISVVAGDIDYGLDKIDGLQNDPDFPEGPLNENGCYLLSITDTLPNAPHINLWWHQHRKMVIDVDNNIWGHGMPNPIFMVYFNKENTLVAYDGDQNIWQNEWTDAVHYQENYNTSLNSDHWLRCKTW